MRDELDAAGLEAQLEAARQDEDWWWVEAVLAEFDFLVSDFGYRLKDVFLHFRGDSVTYEGSVWSLVIGYDPEFASASAELWRTGAGEDPPPSYPIPRLLARRAPDIDWQEHNDSLPPELVRVLLARWASGLKLYAADVFRGSRQL